MEANQVSIIHMTHRLFKCLFGEFFLFSSCYILDKQIQISIHTNDPVIYEYVHNANAYVYILVHV